MDLTWDARLITIFLLLLCSGVLTRPHSATDVESKCPVEWLFVGNDRCAYVIPSEIPHREHSIFCQVQFNSILVVIQDKSFCLKSTEVTEQLEYGTEGFDTYPSSKRNRLFKRVFGNSGLGRK